MTALVCIDTKIGAVRRYERAQGCGANNVLRTHQLHIKDWPLFLQRKYFLDRCAIARFRTEPEAFYT